MEIVGKDQVDLKQVETDPISVSRSSIVIHGICKEVHLVSKSSAKIYGMVDYLTIDKSSAAEVFGIVKHAVNDGSLRIHGIVNTLDDPGNKAEIIKDAIVNGQHY